MAEDWSGNGQVTVELWLSNGRGMVDEWPVSTMNATCDMANRKKSPTSGCDSRYFSTKRLWRTSAIGTALATPAHIVTHEILKRSALTAYWSRNGRLMVECDHWLSYGRRVMAEEWSRNGRAVGVIGWVMVGELFIMVEEWSMDSRLDERAAVAARDNQLLLGHVAHHVNLETREGGSESADRSVGRSRRRRICFT